MKTIVTSLALAALVAMGSPNQAKAEAAGFNMIPGYGIVAVLFGGLAYCEYQWKTSGKKCLPHGQQVAAVDHDGQEINPYVTKYAYQGNDFQKWAAKHPNLFEPAQLARMGINAEVAQAR